MISFKIILIFFCLCLFIRFKTKNFRKKSKDYQIFYSTDKYPILKYFENSWLGIYNEAIKLPKNVNSVPNFDRINQKIIDYIIMENDYLIGRNSQLCPITSSLLNQFNGVILAKFIVIKPFSISNITTNPYNQNFNISYCLGISIPNDGKVKLYSSNNSMSIIPARSFIFDSSYPHYFENQSNYDDAIILYLEIKKLMS